MWSITGCVSPILPLLLRLFIISIVIIKNIIISNMIFIGPRSDHSLRMSVTD